MDAKQRKIFEAYFQQRAERESAFSMGDKLELVRRLYQEAAEQGMLPIAPNRIARVNVETPRVQAILEGRDVAIGGTQIQGGQTFRQRLAELPAAVKLGLMLLIGVFLVGSLVLGGKVASGKGVNPTRIPTETATMTATATETVTPGSVYPTATPYDVVLDSAGSPKGPHDPVSVAFASVAFTLKQAKLEAGEWLPAVAEWLPGTELRRVVAVPYTQEVGMAVGQLGYGDEITLRLRSGEVVVYQIADIRRVQRYEIEILNSLRPSLVVILHGERSGERWVLVANAVQGAGLPALTATPTSSPTPSLTPAGRITATLTPTKTSSPTPTPTLTPSVTPSPTQTATPAFAFTPPVPVTEVFTETLTVTNTAAGLEMSLLECSEVAQVGSNQGNFVVCDVVLTALRSRVAYSGDTLAITERVQVEQVPGWWPPPLSVIGGVGSGMLAQPGDTASGRVAGEIARSQSDPVLLWEQAGLRYVIILASSLDD